MNEKRHKAIATIIIGGTAKSKTERTTNSGKRIIAVNLKSDKGFYIDLECWNSALDEVEENDLIMVTGELDQNSWENKETGKRQYKFRINVDACRNYGKEQTPF